MGLASVLKSRVKTAYSRIRRNRITTAFFVFSFVHCFAQGIIQSFLYQIDAEYDGVLSVVKTAANIPQRNITYIEGTSNDYVLRMCSDIPFGRFPCIESFRSSVDANSTTLDSSDRSGIALDRFSEGVVAKPLIDRASGNVNGVSLESGPEKVALSSQCTQILLYPQQLMHNSEREDVIFILLQFWLFSISFMAIVTDSIPHTLAVLVTRALITGWSIYAIWRTKYIEGIFQEVIFNSGTPCSIDLFPTYFSTRLQYEIGDLILNCTALFIASYLSWILLKEYNDYSVKCVGAPAHINRIIKFFMAVLACLQLECFVLVASMGLWIDVLINSAIGRLSEHTIEYEGLFIVTTVLLLPWIAMGWYAIRGERRRLMWVFLGIAFFILAGWSIMFYSMVYRWTFLQWPFIACFIVASFVLIGSSMILGIICRLNFGKGLKEYLRAEAALASSNFSSEVFLHDEDKAGPIEFVYVEKVNSNLTPTIQKALAPLSHPSIVDGWFREISSQWPGQAMTLKVNKILHVEKSLYQDVLVFESETFGNVLILDGVIQCTERDEFSYQEMIAHLPLASHPNPKKVLVIGGGDGGVVREVLKHSTVDEVILCDIDEAVPRVSKQYLPHMASVLSDPRVTVHIGDGFKFLATHEGTYDAIITDSSDPVGPAESLFQKPYFQLLHDALAPGGHISTQGECQWIHLPLISNLRNMTAELFPVAEYAFTTIPTYPSGQIGFLVCSKEAGRDLRTPVRDVQGTLYYNKAVHSAAFVLPEFARTMIDKGVDITPKFGRAALAQASADKPKKKILLLGSGFVARPCAEYVVRNPTNELTIACRTLKSAEALGEGLPSVTALSLDVNDKAALEKEVAAHDLVISLIPYTYHAAVISAAIKGKTHVVTTSYVSPAMRELDAAAREAGIVVMNEIGLDPGIDHLYAVKTIDEVHAKGGKIVKFLSYCGGLPAPECSGNPLGYKFSWSSRGVLLALLNSASYYDGGEKVNVTGSELMKHAQPYFISPAFAFVAYPNRDSTPFKEFYNILEAETVVRGTLRYQGFPEFIKALVDLGWLDQTEKDWLTEGLTWAEVMQKVVGASDAKEATLVAKVKELCKFPNESEATRIISGLRWIGLFSQEQVKPRSKNLLDTLCAQLETLMKYEENERDLVMLQHKFIIQWQDGRQETLTSTLEAYGRPGGHSAMALTVGVPCGIAVQLVLDGVLKTPGVHAPYSAEICNPIRELLEQEGLGMIERVL